jgi:2-aminoadipate transaminase
MAGVKASDVREILKLTARPEIISFAGGLPAPELFPVEEMRVASDLVLKEAGPVALQYATTEGNPRLREQIAERMGRKNGIKTTAANILMTSGSQQGLDYSARVFVDPGDVIIIESPSYLGALNAFKACEPNFIAIPTDENGMIMEELEKVLATTERVKMIYVIPDFQNPSGRTWPLERRKQFMEIINKYEIPTIEDNPYGDLRFKGEFLPALRSMDEKDLIIYFGTFSKILSPGFRMGWINASTEIVEKVNLIMQASALQTPTINALVISKYLDMFDIDAHVEKIRAVYKRRCQLMIDTMRAEFPPEVKFTDPDGGLFTWVELPEGIDTRELAPKAMAQNVAYVPGSGFYPSGTTKNCMRLNYSNATDERIVEGIKRLGKVIREALA